MAMEVDEATCSGCGACIDECPQEAIDVPVDVATIDQGLCVDCAACVGACPTESIQETD